MNETESATTSFAEDVSKAASKVSELWLYPAIMYQKGAWKIVDNEAFFKMPKEILEQKGKSVRWVARETTISPTTIYSIIQKDTSIRFDFALRIANALGIEVSEICSDASLNSENWDKNDSITLPELPSGMDEILDGNRIKRYLKNTLYPLMCLFGKNNMPKLDEHLTNYYQLSDEGRNDVDQYIKAQLSIKRDPDRAADIKKITKW